MKMSDVALVASNANFLLIHDSWSKCPTCVFIFVYFLLVPCKLVDLLKF